MRSFFELQRFAKKGVNIRNDGGNTLVGGTSRNDTIFNGESYVTISGGGGDDSISNGYIGNSYYPDAHDASVSGGKGNDTILVSGEYSTIYGGAGNDQISLANHYSRGEVIQYYSGDGNDTVYGFDSNDILYIAKGKYSTTTSGNDFIVTVGKQRIVLKDSLEDKNNKIRIKNSAGKISVYNDWSTRSGVTGNTADNVKIISDKTADTLTGYTSIGNHDGLNVTLQGGKYNDGIYNNSGDHVLMYGDAGDDQITNASHYDATIAGGKGNDRIALRNGSGSKNIIQYASGDGNDIIYGFDSNDILQITKGSYQNAP